MPRKTSIMDTKLNLGKIGETSIKRQVFHKDKCPTETRTQARLVRKVRQVRLI